MSRTDTGSTTRRAAEEAVRSSYGRLVAILAARSRNVAAAEDALSEALATALRVWPADGVPERPEAWLVTAARRALGHAARHGRVRDAAAATLEILGDKMAEIDQDAIPDERLRLMFVCAHPAIDAAVQAPLMLQTVLGLDAARIAGSFLASPATMAQRLVRAKAKIREAGIPFEMPEARELPDRLDAVLSAIYAAYGTGWEDVIGSDPKRKGLAEEAIWLGRVVARLLPRSSEAKGLLALMLLACEARRTARRGADGGFVALSDQDVALWDRDMIDEAEAMLREASEAGMVGRFQIEACIQSVHLQRRITGRVAWPALVAFYDLLVGFAPTVGNRVARAAALAEAGGPAAGLGALDAIGPEAAGYQPYWATRAHLLALARDMPEAVAAYGRAAGMSEDPALREFLLAKAERLRRS